MYLQDVIPADLSQCNQAAAFLQSGFWGSFKARFGWNARSFTLDWGLWGKTPLLLIRRRLMPGCSFGYVPWGPELPPAFPVGARNGALTELAVALRGLLPEDTAFVRFEPPWYTEGPGTPPPMLQAPFVKGGANIQPPDTVLIDLDGPEQEILAQMKGKWRYNVNLARRRGVEVTRTDEAGLERFYRLLRETAKRDGMAIHALSYYRTLFAHCRDYPEGGQELRLYVATHEAEDVAALAALFRGTTAVFLYGASSNRKRNYMASYALQWRTITDARAKGCRVYDLFGIPPANDPDHPMAGLFRFKTGFGGRIIHRPGSWDYPYRPVLSRLFRLAESVRRTLTRRRRAIRLFCRTRQPGVARSISRR